MWSSASVAQQTSAPAKVPTPPVAIPPAKTAAPPAKPVTPPAKVTGPPAKSAAAVPTPGAVPSESSDETSAAPSPAPLTRPAPASDAASPGPNDAQREEAAERYRLALTLFGESRFDASLAEFRRAYELAPTYRILYNIALVSVELGDSVGARAAFRQYLEDGGDDIPAARRAEVQKEIDALEPRVARLIVHVDEPGAEVFVDDVARGVSPLSAPLDINAGRRRVVVYLEGRDQVRIVEVAGQETAEVKFRLHRPTPAAAPAPVPPAPPQEQARPFPWVPWGVTVGLAAATTVAGVGTLVAKADQDATQDRLGASPAELESAQATVQSWATTTDVFLAATIVSAGLAVYLTFEPFGGSGNAKPIAQGVRSGDHGVARASDSGVTQRSVAAHGILERTQVMVSPSGVMARVPF